MCFVKSNLIFLTVSTLLTLSQSTHHHQRFLNGLSPLIKNPAKNDHINAKPDTKYPKPFLNLNLHKIIMNEIQHRNRLKQKTEPQYSISGSQLNILTNSLKVIDVKLHEAQAVVKSIKNAKKPRIHYNYYDDTIPDDYDYASRKRAKASKKYSSSESESGSESDSESEEAEPTTPARFAIIDKHQRKRPREPVVIPPVESDKSSEQSEEVTTAFPLPKKKKEKEDTYDYIQGKLRKIKNKGRRAGMKLDYFLPKRYHWKEEDMPKLGYLWFNTGVRR